MARISATGCLAYSGAHAKAAIDADDGQDSEATTSLCTARTITVANLGVITTLSSSTEVNHTWTGPTELGCSWTEQYDFIAGVDANEAGEPLLGMRQDVVEGGLARARLHNLRDYHLDHDDPVGDDPRLPRLHDNPLADKAHRDLHRAQQGDRRRGRPGSLHGALERHPHLEVAGQNRPDPSTVFNALLVTSAATAMATNGSASAIFHEIPVPSAGCEGAVEASSELKRFATALGGTAAAGLPLSREMDDLPKPPKPQRSSSKSGELRRQDPQRAYSKEAPETDGLQPKKGLWGAGTRQTLEGGLEGNGRRGDRRSSAGVRG